MSTAWTQAGNRKKNPATTDQIPLDDGAGAKHLTIEDGRRKFSSFAVASMTDLMNEDMDRFDDGDRVTLLGFYGAGDGGGGPVYYDASEDRANHNGVDIIDPTHSATPGSVSGGWYASDNTGTGCFKRPKDNVFDVRKAGIVSGGLEDQAIILNNIKDAGYRILWLPENYTIKVVDNSIDLADGMIIMGNGATIDSEISNVSGVSKLLNITNIENVLIEDLNFTEDYSQTIIHVENSTSVHINRCHIDKNGGENLATGGIGSGIRILSSSFVFVKGCTLKNIRRVHGIDMNDGGNSYIYIEENYFSNIWSSGVRTEGGINNLHVKRNTFENCMNIGTLDDGVIDVYSSDGVNQNENIFITDNEVTGGNDSASLAPSLIRVNSTDKVRIIDNILTADAENTALIQLRARDGVICSNVIISDNYLDDKGHKTSFGLIRLDSDNSFNVEIKSNELKRDSEDDAFNTIYILASMRDLSIHDNKFTGDSTIGTEITGVVEADVVDFLSICNNQFDILSGATNLDFHGDIIISNNIGLTTGRLIQVKNSDRLVAIGNIWEGTALFTSNVTTEQTANNINY